MTLFKALLVVMCVVVLAYTGIAVSNEGINLFAKTFPSLLEMGWPGQFHMDFLTYLVLSGIWVAWRHQFSAGGILLGVLAANLRMIFLSHYLLLAISKSGGDMRKVFLGEARAQT